MSIPFIHRPEMGRYDFGKHPFRAANVDDLREYLDPHIEDGMIALVEPDLAVDDDLKGIHSDHYINRVHRLEATQGHLSPDTWVAKGTPAAALSVVGGAIEAVDLALGGETTVLLPGGFHHAGVDYGEGFCIFNDVAVAAQRAVDAGLERVLVLDTDAHQGNGTMDIFWERDDVLFISLHQDPRTLYPGRGFAGEIGTGEGRGFTVNIPMFPYSSDDVYVEAFERIVEPVVQQYRPQLVIRNGGADPHHRDMLTMLGMTMDGFRMFGERTAAIARDAGAPHIDMCISGYGTHAVPGWLQIWSGVTGLDLTVDFREGEKALSPNLSEQAVREETRKALDTVEDVLSPFWNVG